MLNFLLRDGAKRHPCCECSGALSAVFQMDDRSIFTGLSSDTHSSEQLKGCTCTGQTPPARIRTNCYITHYCIARSKDEFFIGIKFLFTPTFRTMLNVTVRSVSLKTLLCFAVAIL